MQAGRPHTLGLAAGARWALAANSVPVASEVMQKVSNTWTTLSWAFPHGSVRLDVQGMETTKDFAELRVPFWKESPICFEIFLNGVRINVNSSVAVYCRTDRKWYIARVLPFFETSFITVEWCCNEICYRKKLAIPLRISI